MLSKRISIIALVIAILLVVSFILTTMLSKPVTEPISQDVHFWSIDKPESDTAFGGIFAGTRFINDSLPHYRYKQILDSFERIQNERNLENESNIFSGHWVGSFGVAVFDGPEQFKDTGMLNRSDGKYPQIKMSRGRPQQKENDLYYISLKGYSLEKDTRFFIQNATYNLAYVQWDSIEKNYHYGHYEQKRIPVRHSAERKMIFIPITKSQYSIISVLVYIGLAVVLVLFLYIAFNLPIQILVNIGKGKAFIPDNIHNIRFIAYSLFAFSLWVLFTPYILRFFFRHQIPDDFQLESFWTGFFNQLYPLFAAIALFLISKAFERGYKLQEEQNLTI